MTPELMSALGKLKCEKKMRISFCLQNRSVYRVNPLMRKRKQASLTLIELPQATPPEGWGASSREIPSHTAKDRGGSSRSPVEQLREGPCAHTHVGKVLSEKIIRAAEHPVALPPSRLLPLLHNILTSLRQEPNSIYLAVHQKTTGALSPLAEGQDA